MTLRVATVNLLSTNLISDICETPEEYRSRYQLAIQQLRWLLSRVDAAVVQEGDPEFHEVLKGAGIGRSLPSGEPGLQYQRHFMGPPRDSSSKSLYVFWNPDRLELLADYTPLAAGLYRSLDHLPPSIPYRGQLLQFRTVSEGIPLLLGNLHGSGTHPEVTVKVIAAMAYAADQLKSAQGEMPVVLGGDIYLNCGNEALPPAYGCITAPVDTTVHNFTQEGSSITYRPKRNHPEFFLFQGLSPTGHWVVPSAPLEDGPYQYRPGCLAPGRSYSMTDLDRCRLPRDEPAKGSVAEKLRRLKVNQVMEFRPGAAIPGDGAPSKGLSACQGHRRSQGQAKLSHWFSDHAALLVEFSLFY